MTEGLGAIDVLQNHLIRLNKFTSGNQQLIGLYSLCISLSIFSDIGVKRQFIKKNQPTASPGINLKISSNHLTQAVI